ncbi:hypothetical protein BJF88_10120 [Cellulosimicrobium sp. CUA-896]|nr:hypothetical protein BJF88_10120 [Cellulosimicrobium sp. CUA-896]
MGDEMYSTVIRACHQLGDLDRTRTRAKATGQWCEHFQGEVVPSRICGVHRLQLLCAEGG